MGTPGDFGGGGAGPDQIFPGITRAPTSAPKRGRAQSPVRRAAKPEPPDHRARAALRAARKMGFIRPRCALLGGGPGGTGEAKGGGDSAYVCCTSWVGIRFFLF
jgi:hypothetical protein